ncbi:hypothetical protein V6N11_079635 [Hibiscus sabdariffa]|uniref:Uncharacterized protein n=1 Tax=Hibiscus sabdariffa TaxID=183260 RepID=A0ABR2RWT7_9ROSI
METMEPCSSFKDRHYQKPSLNIRSCNTRVYMQRTVLAKTKSGNNGIGLAAIAVANGYRLIIAMPFGARVVLPIRLKARKVQLRRPRNLWPTLLNLSTLSTQTSHFGASNLGKDKSPCVRYQNRIWDVP